MADVFLSYASEDRRAAERLANAICESGLTVWWDRHIKGGAEFSRDIERELAEASRVLVLWSKEAVNSRWVRDEASVAVDTCRLISATIDGTPPPLGFRQFQTINLKRWAVRGTHMPPELSEALDVTIPAASQNNSRRSARRRLIVTGIAAALAITAGAIVLVKPPPFDAIFAGESKTEGLPLAVMPFVVERDPSISYLGVGLSSAIADSLEPLSGLKITAMTSSRAIAGQGLTAPEIGKKLGVSHFVEGDVQKREEGYAISVRLIETRSSEQIWTRSFESSAQELQAVKHRMARELASAIRARLGVAEGEVRGRGTVDPEAYEAYLRALEQVSVRDERESRLEAIKQFRLAASIDPDFAEAHAGQAYLLALSLPYQVGMPWEQLMAEQRRANARALELDPRSNLAQIAKAVALRNFEGDPSRSAALEKAVMDRSPNFIPAHYSLAASLWMQGRSREALYHMDRAIDRDPFDAHMRFYRISILNSLGDYEAVRESVQRCPPPCAGAAFLWGVTMAGFATPIETQEDLPLLAARLKTDGIPEQVIEQFGGFIRAMVLGAPFSPSPLENDDQVTFSYAAGTARVVSFEKGLRYALIARDTQQPDSVLDMLNEGRVTFSPEQRADPRYHQLFQHPKLVKIAVARRSEGVTAGLPLFPIKAYKGR